MVRQWCEWGAQALVALQRVGGTAPVRTTPVGRFGGVAHMMQRPGQNGICRSRVVTEYLLLLLGTALVNNVVLTKFLGLCPFMGVSNRLDTALGMGLATTFVLTLAAVASWLIEHFVLIPLDIGFLRILSFILVIAATVQFTELVIRKSSPLLYQTLGIFLPLITTNCAVLGVALLNVQSEHGFIESLVFGLGAALGFTLVLVLFSMIRERVAAADVPLPFQGAAIALVTAGIMSMGFMGFAGLIT